MLILFYIIWICLVPHFLYHRSQKQVRLSLQSQSAKQQGRCASEELAALCHCSVHYLLSFRVFFLLSRDSWPWAMSFSAFSPVSTWLCSNPGCSFLNIPHTFENFLLSFQCIILFQFIGFSIILSWFHCLWKEIPWAEFRKPYCGTQEKISWKTPWRFRLPIELGAFWAQWSSGLQSQSHLPFCFLLVRCRVITGLQD